MASLASFDRKKGADRPGIAGVDEAGRGSLCGPVIAAAVLLASGYDGSRPLHDPMCGSGTLAIEAALIAKNRAPGLNRGFGVERWPSFGPTERKLLGDLRVKAREAERAGLVAP